MPMHQLWMELEKDLLNGFHQDQFPARLYRESAPKPRSPAGRGTHVPRSAKTVSVRLKSRPKSKAARPITHHDPGNLNPRSATLQPPTPRCARPKRASREVTPRGRATRLTYRARTISPTRGTMPRIRPRIFIGQISIRPNAAVDPKPFLKPNPHNSSPKPAL
ncbi:unnamed protein product [Microthlaspi erraticum]|uniref:Uncharacterized protein n=1 Tax=Microthlaspi erraticum TaxID=1685480 RepID=A0A6D2L7C4_9BRAS|nr:unnamed protein product [Microthlaspi erraticum]CAA7057067.1 unnamed protein product [Microthlaspi erraticum]